MKFFIYVSVSAAVMMGVSAPTHAQTLKQTAFSDGTGSIGLAPGWRIDGANKGSVQCLGPNGAAVILKVPWVILRPESSLNDLSSAENSPVAPAGDVPAALREIMKKKVGATLKNMRMRRAASAPGGPPAYVILYEFSQNGKALTGLGYFAALDYGSSQPFWQLYSSAIVAPTKTFAQAAPTMVKMWRSWKPNGLPPKEGSTSAIFDKIVSDRQLSYQKIQNEAGKLLQMPGKE